MQETAALRSRSAEERIRGASLSHELKTPSAAIRAAARNLRANLQAFIASSLSAEGAPAGRADLLRYLARAVSEPRTAPPPTGIEAMQQGERLTSRLGELGLGDKAPEAARIILKHGWANNLEEILPFLLSAGTEVVLPLLDAAGKMRSNLASIEASAATLEGIARDLDAGSRAVNGRKDVALREGIDDALATLEPGRGEGVEINVACDPEVRFPGNPTQIRQVILNLVGNALRAVPRPGGRIDLAAAAEGDEIVLRVRDNGPGIAEELRAEIFSPFVTTRQGGESSGLGLYISKSLVEAHGGSLAFTSRPGETQFEARFPGRRNGASA